MKIKTKVNKTPLFIGIMLIVIGELVLRLLPEIDMNSASPWEVYQLAMAVQFWAGMAILGWAICFIWGIVFLVRSKWPRTECKTCGAEIKSKDDIFCRECGANFKKK